LDDVSNRIGALAQPEGKGARENGLPQGLGLHESSGALERLLGAVLGDRSGLDALADERGMDAEYYTFLACQSLLPFLEKCALSLRRHIDPARWVKGTCPVCGGRPLMARLDMESGKRYLQCSLCRSDWPHGRLECPFCGNTDQDSLRYFFDESDKAHRVEVCDKCKGYVKTTDTRVEQKDVVVVVENVATLHLDLVAKREGFLRGAEFPGL
jgi:FdhE protein